MDPNTPHDCPGTASEQAGQAPSCAGCPNQGLCSSGAGKGPDPDVKHVRARMGHVRHKILVLSGKGGVGKSTFTAQLAFGLAADEETQVGVLDVDICGPSIPRLLGVQKQEVHQSGSGWSPVYARDNLAVMSIAFLLPNESDAVIWRGPKKNGLIKQFLKDVDWGDIDFLVIDTPPGTSDEHLSLAQYLREDVAGAVIITTPQEVSLLDVRKEISFVKKVGIKVIGVVENMSGFVCPNCKTESLIFPPTTGGASQMCAEMNVPFLGKLPLDPRIGKCCDNGQSFVEEVPDSPATAAYMQIINDIKQFCDKIDADAAAASCVHAHHGEK